MKREQRLIVALDGNHEQALHVCSELARLDVGYKVGLRLLLEIGGHARMLSMIREGKRVMLDLKLADQLDTVETVVQHACMLGMWAITVHAHDQKTLEAAMIGREKATIQQGNQIHTTKLLGVTVLSSQTRFDLEQQAGRGTGTKPFDMVSSRTARVIGAGFDGVVCPARLAHNAHRVVSQEGGPEFLIVTPGVRLPYHGSGSHILAVDPHVALDLGATHLIIGRPITAADKPVVAAMEYINSMAGDERA